MRLLPENVLVSENVAFDYVIVGAGSAGCALAARLSEDAGVTVCLLEAGPRDRHPLIHVPMGILWMMHSRTLNWRYYTGPQQRLGGRRLFWPRGRTLGGSSSSNAMVYTRGHPWDYDHWRNLGNEGWSYADVLPYFRRAENRERGASEYHGVGGPLNVAPQRSPNPLSLAFVEAGRACGYPVNDDFSGPLQEGVGLYEVTQRNGRRFSTARAYLGAAGARPNLTVLTGAHAAQVLFEGRRATGVAYRREGRDLALRAGREVILCGGAVNSPQLLLLSGVGPAEPLRRLGIPVVQDLPGVGRNLQDHLDIIVVQASRKPVSYGFTAGTLVKGLGEAARYLAVRRGMLATNGAEAGGFVRSTPEQPIPDLQFHFTAIPLSNHGLDLPFLCRHGYSLHVCDLRPRSRGEIALESADPFAHPRIDPNYLAHPEDLETLVRGFKAVRQVFAAPAFDPYRGEEIRPGFAVKTDEEIRDFIRRHAETIYHPVGTCMMGTNGDAVVDPQLRVHGLEALRVADASIMPTLVGGNTNAPAVMIAEKAADLILGRPAATAGHPPEVRKAA